MTSSSNKKTSRNTGNGTDSILKSVSAADESGPGVVLSNAEITALVKGQHDNPFAVLGFHTYDSGRVIRTFQPTALGVDVVDGEGRRHAMRCLHEAGLYEVVASELSASSSSASESTVAEDQKGEALPSDYALDVHYPTGHQLIFDAYTFHSQLGELDHHLVREGRHVELYKKLGSHCQTLKGVAGVHFAVWAPNASICSVVGDFNLWDERRHVMRKHHESGVWEIFVPGAFPGSLYKYALFDRAGNRLADKNDPYAHAFEPPPGNAAVVYQSSYCWTDEQWLKQRKTSLLLDEPVSIYEVHLQSWRHNESGESFSYTELVQHLIPYAVDNGFTHLELMPVTEHPFAGSWGYQPIGLFAPTHRLGSADDFRYFVDRCHASGLGVIMDWVPAHFPGDEHGLALFDGTHLYEHADPRQGRHKDWDTLIYNFGRREVSNYLLCNALFWIREFHLDGLRVDAVASMLYLDYSREDGEWIPNQFGGNHNLEAVEFLQSLNSLVHAEGAITLAEESTSWDGVTRPVFSDGLGFTYKWNMGWMHDILEYMSIDPIHRRHHHDKLTFGLLYAFSENFVLPISHDEVVYGKRSLLGKMPGDHWQQHAHLRCLYGFMFAYPGKKLLFMGSEFGQLAEWSHDGQLHWEMLGQEEKLQVLQLVKNLNLTYRVESSLHRGDCHSEGFQWMDCDDAENSVIAFYRRVPGSAEAVIAVCNFTPIAHENYRIGVFDDGLYREILSTDEAQYGGSGVVNDAGLHSEEIRWHEKPYSFCLRVPPLGVTFLKRSG